MAISSAERKQIENEMIFRRLNEKLGSDLDALDVMHKEDGNLDLLHDDLLLIEFKCECSDEKCAVRISLRLSKYRELHLSRNDFIVKVDHQIDAIEKVISREDGYNVVKKIHSIPEPGDRLNITTLDNANK